MHAYLLISKNDQSVQEKAQQIAGELHAVLSPFVLQKISDVRDLGQYTKLSLAQPTAFFIEHIEKASLDTANAFLKQLEEPKPNVAFILTAASEDKVLPTIVSRCQVIRVRGLRLEIGSKEISDFVHASTGQKLLYVDTIKKRDDAIEFVQNVICQLHTQLTSQTINYQLLTNYLAEAQKTLTSLEKNGNVTIQLTRFVVGLSQQE